ncbi:MULTISPECIES: hypothetical protein [unclassified Gilliamella]|uniref:hypothetical protein n=1 Tax=unclassified Gilliamella TaxID=2685620 RepID=UPI00080DE818|nr:hypothetical protein [Gilliamella apicola]OCG20554.1 hypothetical protein A9G23_06945 [Gilliamella apicola]OCG24563.1 hypothetical protein A9G22_03905 [Gilliamella apicola]
MSHVIYLSSKVANKPALIFIQINNHNPKGWVEKPNGQAIKLHQPLTGNKHEQLSTRSQS